MIRGATALFVILAVLCGAGCVADPGRIGSAASAPTKAPAKVLPEQPFGLKWDGYRHPPTADDPVIEEYGGGATFHEIVWCAVEPRQGERNWWLDDRVVTDLLSYGYRVMLRIRVGACWASGQPTARRPRMAVSFPPVDTAAYQSFVRDLVARYAPLGVHLYGIENEIDANNMWGVDPLAYREVGRAGAQAVRQADVQARVLDVGLTSASYGIAVSKALLDAGRADQALTFYRDFYAGRGDGGFPPATTADELRAAFALPRAQRALAAHAANLELDQAGVFDIFQLHYYAGWAAAADVIDYIRGRVPAGMPIEAWELGFYWPGADYDPVRHGVETAKLLAVLLARGVDRLVYLPLDYSPDSAVVATEHWRGLFGDDGAARPAKTVLEEFRKHFATGTWRPVTRQGLNGGIAGQGATTTLVLWSAGGSPISLPRPAGASSITVTTLPDGRSRDWTSGTLDVGADPLIVSVPASAGLGWLEAA
ncbi:hypothetical protein GCM10023194_60150 [Planotetraspora phitsanulokensis]|uniref:Asl1-like glycosyl hydrolase catalytic domain-containing protein n=1 Tax=Planotetraspora phitsanulokensis TaxID=575192 RepID=A0A8J3U3K1_9ACTN|nr:hypothetical protein [Planotetraspora phitsanulokensis]GII37764.1 hypothetical protein Pph01_27670 [Planotetraspora phitsanulokensis]